MITKKGLHTRQKILDSAKKFFYENGYDATTVAQITDDAEVNIGLFIYYFGTKAEIATVIAMEYISQLRNLISKKIFEQYGSYNLALGLAVEYRKNAEITMSDPNLLRFNVQRATPSNEQNLNHSHFSQLLKRLVNPAMTDQDVMLYEIVGIATVRSVYSAYYEKPDCFDQKYLSDNLIRICFTLLKLDTAQIEELLIKSQEIADSISIRHIPYFTLS